MARKILLADDSVTAQNMGRKILTDAGYEVITVNNGSAALKKVSEQKPDLIVLDVYMPGYSGLEVCQRLKESAETSRIPILLTVGKLEPFKPEDARRANADAHIVKPFEASELLGALTRLEDRMVPQADAPRFSTMVSGIERFGGEAGRRRSEPEAESDVGWKSRIRFPSEKPKTPEPEPDLDFVTTPSFRDFRRGPGKPPVKQPAKSAAAEAAQEPGLVPDIPRDITPDELDALSALVAKLDGPIPQSEDIAPLGDALGPSVPEPKAEAPAASAALVETQPVAEPAAVSGEVPQQQGPAPAFAEASQAEQPAATAEEAAVGETATSAAPSESVASAPEYSAVPVDRDNEPVFALAPSAVQQADVEESRKDQAETSGERSDSIEQAQTGVETGAENQSLEPEGQSLDQPELEERAGAEVPSQADQSQTDQAQAPPAQVEETPAAAVTEQAVAEATAAPEDRVPTEDELAEALRLLTPHHEAAPENTGTAAALDQPEPVPATVFGSRWVAETAQLTPEDLSGSLEEEMFRRLAAHPASAPEPVSAGMGPSEQIAARDEVAESAMADALVRAAADMAAAAVPLPEMAVEIRAAANTPDADSRSEQPAEEPAPATFADAVEHTPGGESSTPENAQAFSEPARSAFREIEPATSETFVGGQEAMGKEAKTGKAGKSGWHQIRTAPAATAASDVVEAAKQSEVEPSSEEAPKAMAAAAAGADASSSSAADPNAIASIVDSVLADLRPKIVEEIAKKLGKK